MRNLTKTLLALGFGSAIAATTAVAQLNIQATFDENGHGVITGAALAGLPDPYTVPFGVGVDPVSGLTTLFYTLPTTVTSGDILLFEPGQQGPSDLIRFVQNRMYFFSELEPTDVAPFDLADGLVIPPVNPTTPVVLLDEAGVEGNNGATWKPLTPADPGFAAAVGPSVTYNFVSDAVPEPNTLALLGLGGGLLIVAQRRRAARV
jgi:hypothetical protein